MPNIREGVNGQRTLVLNLRAQQSSSGPVFQLAGAGAAGGHDEQQDLEEVVSTVVAFEIKGSEAGKKIPKIISESKVKVPTVHKFAAGVPGVTGKNVAKAVSDDKALLDKAFEGCTPMDLAIACNNSDRLQALLDRGADPNCKNGMAKRPLEGGDCLPGKCIFAQYDCSTLN